MLSVFFNWPIHVLTESGLEIENIKQNQMAWQSQVKTVDVVCWSINMLRVEIESQIAQTTCRVCCLTHLVARPVIKNFTVPECI